MKNYKITKQEFKKLYSKDITVREADKILSKIDKRFNYIMKILIPGENTYAYDSSGCKFDVYNFTKYIDYICTDEDEDEEFDNYVDEKYNDQSEENDGWAFRFPTKWLWEDFEKCLKNNDSKNDHELKELLALEKSILDKLNSEELEFLGFTKNKGKLTRYHEYDGDDYGEVD